MYYFLAPHVDVRHGVLFDPQQTDRESASIYIYINKSEVNLR